jgi:hypothetical protein
MKSYNPGLSPKTLRGFKPPGGSVLGGGNVMRIAAQVEEVVDRVVGREEALRLPSIPDLGRNPTGAHQFVQ